MLEKRLWVVHKIFEVILVYTKLNVIGLGSHGHVQCGPKTTKMMSCWIFLEMKAKSA